MALSVLFIGGTGQISLPCVRVAAEAGHRVTVFNRGRTAADLPAGTATVAGDLNDPAALAALAARKFDVVCQFMGFFPEQVERDIAAFAGHTGQYVYISSASVYEKPPRSYIITEKTPAVNPYWDYSQRKIASEQLLQRQDALPWTIVRPSHTLRIGLPAMLSEGDVVGHRMLAGKPVIVCGDGATPWTLTRSVDFAKPFVGLLGNAGAIRDIFHITSDRGHLWNDIYAAIGRGLGVEPKIVHVPTETLIRYRKAWEGPLTGDKAWTALFDNSKVKRVSGPFTCSENLDEVLADSLANFRKRRDAGIAPPPAAAELEPLIDRIAAEQAVLGR